MKRISKGARKHLLNITRSKRKRRRCFAAVLSSLADLGFYHIPNPIIPPGLKPKRS